MAMLLPSNSLLLLICTVQFLTILYMLSIEGRGGGRCDAPPSPAIVTSTQTSHDEEAKNQTLQSPSLTKQYPAVAAMVMLGQPKWFQRRYTFMVQNVLHNIPQDWAVQIFHSTDRHTLAGITLNTGLDRLVQSGRILLTPIPEALQKRKKRRIELMADQWLWQNLVADKVLIFSGTTVICSNSPYQIEDFLSFDYIGAPWDAHHGLGGEGSISLRSRQLMIAILTYEEEKHQQKSEEDRANAYKTYGYEDHFFVSRIVEMQRKGILSGSDYRIAAKNDSMRFAAFEQYQHDDVWAVSGTLPSIPFDRRDKFLGLCPEVKIFYPALHDPNCFGAAPNGPACAATICALKPKSSRPGGC
eukprot:gene1147-1252_t